MPPPNPAAVVVGMAVIGAVVNLALHRIDEGHVGVYYRGGALLKNIANPGFHMMIPLLTTYRWVEMHTVILELYRVTYQVGPNLSLT